MFIHKHFNKVVLIMSLKGNSFVGGSSGAWKVLSQRTICGAALTPVTNLQVASINDDLSEPMAWRLNGVISNVRYVEKAERAELVSRQEGLGRAAATYGALLPIKKSTAWWELSQDERRDIFEAKSKHIEANMKYLPAIARQLYHSRDLGEEFDFLTWFEFRPEHANLFDEMIQAFRQTLEWSFVEREIDLRLMKN